MFRSTTFAAVAVTLLMASSAFAEDAKPAAKEAPSTFTPAQREELKKLIHDYIVQNPEVLSDGMTALQIKEEREKDAKQKAAVASNAKALKDSPEGTVIGNPKGDVTLVEFFDYNCGYCKQLFPSLIDTMKKDGKLRVVLKEFPILGPSSLTASKAALASVKQGKYTEFHIAMMSHKGSLTDDLVMQIAKETGLNVEKLQADMKSKDIEAVISKNEDMARSMSIGGTPSLVIGGSLVEGAVKPSDLQDMIADARKKS